MRRGTRREASLGSGVAVEKPAWAAFNPSRGLVCAVTQLYFEGET